MIISIGPCKETDVCEHGVCHVDEWSCNVVGSYRISSFINSTDNEKETIGDMNVEKKEKITMRKLMAVVEPLEDENNGMNSGQINHKFDEVGQSQLHDWFLIFIATTSFVAAVTFAVVVGWRFR